MCKWCKNPEEVEFALTVLERLAERYGIRSGLYGIEVLKQRRRKIRNSRGRSAGKNTGSSRTLREAWESSAGWIYWSYKMHSDKNCEEAWKDIRSTLDGWDFVRTMTHGWWRDSYDK